MLRLPYRGNDEKLRKKYSKKYGSKKPTAMIKKYVNTAINKHQELKQYVNSGDVTVLTPFTPNSWFGLNDIVYVEQGVDSSDRVGDKIRLTSIRVGMTIIQEFSNVVFAGYTGVASYVRFLLVQLKRGFTISQVIATLNTASPNSPVTNFDITRRCYILADKLVTLTNPNFVATTTNFATQAICKSVRIKAKPKIEICTWDQNTTTGSSPDIQGAISLLMCYFPVAGGTVPVPSHQANLDSRITFRDA